MKTFNKTIKIHMFSHFTEKYFKSWYIFFGFKNCHNSTCFLLALTFFLFHRFFILFSTNTEFSDRRKIPFSVLHLLAIRFVALLKALVLLSFAFSHYTSVNVLEVIIKLSHC